MPHRTTASGPPPGARYAPWLTSLVMWSNLRQYVRDDGVTVRELQRPARIAKLALAGMARWGYIAVAPDPADRQLKPPRRDWIVRPTAAVRMAQQVWRPLCDVIEKRWQAHFGKDEIGRLREALLALVSQFDADLPEYLPVLQYGLFSGDVYGPGRTGKPEPVPQNLHLPALLSQVLLAFTIQFERGSEVSLAIGSNVLRLLSETGVPVRDLPRLSGVSKEAIQMAVGFLVARRYMVVETDAAASRIKVVRLTARGGRHRTLIVNCSVASKSAGRRGSGKTRHPQPPGVAGAVGWRADCGIVASVPLLRTVPRRMAAGPQA